MALGACTYFCQPDALKGSLTVTMKDVRPTFFFGVPRVWEKIQEKMVQVGRDGSAAKKFIATWAKKLGTEHSRRAQYGQDGTAPCGYSCANKLVFSNVKAALGLDQAKACFTAAAPISGEPPLLSSPLPTPLLSPLHSSPVHSCTLFSSLLLSSPLRITCCQNP